MTRSVKRPPSDPETGLSLRYWFYADNRESFKSISPRDTFLVLPSLKEPLLRMARDLKQVCTICSILLDAMFRSAFILIYFIQYNFKKVAQW